MAAAVSDTSSSELRMSSEPGITGSRAFFMSARAFTLSPICLITSGDGPRKTMPASSQARAKSAFSARKP